MQYLSVLAALLTTTATTFAASIPRQTNNSVWNVTNFFASGGPYSILTTYRFDITDGSISTSCTVGVNTEPEIGYAPVTNCTNPIYSFFFQSEPEIYGTPGYYLQIWEDGCGPNCVYTGQHFFPASDVVTTGPDFSGDPFSSYEYLNTVPNFTISMTGTHI